MSELEQLQTSLMRYLLNPGSETAADCLAFVEDTSVTDSQGLNATQRLGIYANAYRLRLREVMDTDHEMLGLYLGDDLFEQMVTGYIGWYSSDHTSLREYCNRLPEFLRQDAFFAQHPILADLASFERRLFDAFDAADAERADLSALSQIEPAQWPELQVRFHPSVQLCHYATNAVESWQALKHNQTPPAPEAGDIRYWLMWRNRERVTEFSSLHHWQYRLIEGFLQGENLSRQCEVLLDTFDAEETPGQVVTALQAWLEMGIVSRFS